jgi:hypothetical protein
LKVFLLHSENNHAGRAEMNCSAHTLSLLTIAWLLGNKKKEFWKMEHPGNEIADNVLRVFESIIMTRFVSRRKNIT